MKAAAPGSHNIDLLSAKSDAGVPLTATATGGAMGISRTAGTSLQLVGEATSSNAKTDKALFSITMPATYVSGSNFTVSVDCLAAGTGTITGGSTTMTLAAYLESIGVETSLTVSAAQPILTTASVLTFTITGTTSILAGSQVLLEFAMLITSASGANTGNVNSVSYTA
jgi:hypothetical protein